MRVVIQRVRKASVNIDNECISSINEGLLLLVGIEDADSEADIIYSAKKIINMRIFSDQDKKMNLSVRDITGDILSVSQFTLFADTKKGNRPSFTKAGAPSHAKNMYNKFNEILSKELGKEVQAGVFGADMEVNLFNDGPVTILFDSKINQGKPD